MGNRAGQGYGVPKPKRSRCPECSKKGVTGWKVTPFGLSRHCQFCGQAWGEEGWKLARTAGVGATDAKGVPSSTTDGATK